MTEQFERSSERSSDGVRTGMAAVDDVLARIDALDDGDLAEHVEVFSRAHEQLRGVLDAPGEPA